MSLKTYAPCFAGAVQRGDLDTNPANGVRKPASRPPRERVLSDGEIAPAA